MKIIKHTNPSSIKNAWEKLYNENKEITSLQSFEVLCESFVNSRFFPRTYNEKLEIFEFIKNDKTIAFLPLLKKRFHLQKFRNLRLL